MLILAEDDPVAKKSVHLPGNMMSHQEEIIAVKDAIKPGAFSTYFKPFTQEMLLNYMQNVTRQNFRPDKQSRVKDLRQMLIKKISTDLDLGIKSVKHNEQSDDVEKNEASKIEQKLLLQQSGVRGHKVIDLDKKEKNKKDMEVHLKRTLKEKRNS